MPQSPLPLLTASLAALLLTSCVNMKPPQPERTVDGLSRIPTKRIDTVYTAPGMSLASYRRVMLDPVEVAFKRDWQREHPEVSPEDIARIRAQAAAMFRDVFAQELGKGGYTLTDQPAADVLQVTASITDLDISAPDTRSVSAPTRTFVVSAGEMTLLAELRDSQSGAILVRAADREKGREFGNLQIANQVTNSAEARRAFAMWAGLLRTALDTAKEHHTPAQ